MTCLPFLLPSHAVFLPSWSLPQQRSFSFKLPIAPAHPPCLSWAVWARAGLLGFAAEMFLLQVPPLSTECASCLSLEAPEAGKGARQPCASGSSMSCTCKHHCRPRALGRQVKDRLTAHGLCYLSDSKEGEFSPNTSGVAHCKLYCVCWAAAGEVLPVVTQFRHICPSSSISSLAGEVHARPGCGGGLAGAL